MATKQSQADQIYSEVKIDVNGEHKKAAFTVFNRGINYSNVCLIKEKMLKRGYRVGEPIQVIQATEAVTFNVGALLDINDQPIPEEKINEYCLVLDGLHRTHAASRANDELKAENKSELIVLSIEVELIDESITEYINEINCTKLEWKKEDYVRGAASVFPQEEVLQKFNDLIRNDSNKERFPLSTLNRIYFGTNQGLSKQDLIDLCYGKTQKGKKVLRNIIPTYDIDRGDRFIELCKQKGFKTSEIKKRYLITEFNNLKESKQESELAFMVFESISHDDISLMTYDQESTKLDEQKVIDHFQVMKQRTLNVMKQQEPEKAESTD